MVRGWGRPHASDICPLTGVPPRLYHPYRAPFGTPRQPLRKHRAPPKEETSGPNPGHKCPTNNPISKLVRATMRQMSQNSDTKNSAPATNSVSFVPSTDTKTGSPSRQYVPAVPPLLNPLQLSLQQGGSDGVVGLAEPTQVKLAQIQRAHPPRGLWPRGEHHA